MVTNTVRARIARKTTVQETQLVPKTPRGTRLRLIAAMFLLFARQACRARQLLIDRLRTLHVGRDTNHGGQ